MQKRSLWEARKKWAVTLRNSNNSLAISRLEMLLAELVSGWARRGKNMLVMNPVDARFVKALWEYGFDISVQEDCPELMQKIQELMGQRVEYLPAFPDDLPLEDCSFDYIVCVGALEFWVDRKAALREIARVSCSGAVFVFANKYSLMGLSCKLQKHSFPMISPRKLRVELNRAFPGNRRKWRSLFASTKTVSQFSLFHNRFQSTFLPIPVGVAAGVRVDFGNITAKTPLLLTASDPANI